MEGRIPTFRTEGSALRYEGQHGNSARVTPSCSFGLENVRQQTKRVAEDVATVGACDAALQSVFGRGV